MRPIPGNPRKNFTKWTPSTEIPEKSRGKPHKKTLCLVVVVEFRRVMQRPPARAKKNMKLLLSAMKDISYGKGGK